MEPHFLKGNPPLEIILRRSARARRISLRVSSLDGRVTLTLPKGVPEHEALNFAQDKADWIRGHVERAAQPKRVTHGDKIPFIGRDIMITPGSGRRVTLSGHTLTVPGAPEQAAPRIKAWLKIQARESLIISVTKYSEKIGRKHGRITLRDTRSRWGSCNSRGDLMFSWRLVMAPHEVLDYVAAHEVAHLIEMNHSPAFWNIVEKICPAYKTHQRWLRTNGTALHSYRFAD